MTSTNLFTLKQSLCLCYVLCPFLVSSILFPVVLLVRSCLFWSAFASQSFFLWGNPSSATSSVPSHFLRRTRRTNAMLLHRALCGARVATARASSAAASWPCRLLSTHIVWCAAGSKGTSGTRRRPPADTLPIVMIKGQQHNDNTHACISTRTTSTHPSLHCRCLRTSRLLPDDPGDGRNRG